MGRPKGSGTARNRDESDEIEARAAVVSDNEAEAIERIQAAFSDDGHDSTWLIRVNQVVKEPDGSITEGWVFDANIQEIDNIRDRLARDCGPGRYRCRVQRDRKPFKQFDLVILLPIAQRKAALPAAPAAVVTSPAAGISPELLRILENQNRMIEAIANRPAGPTMTDLLSQMKMMSELMPKPVAPDTGYDMFMKALTVAKELVGEGGGGGGGSPILGLVEKIAPMVLEKLPVLAQVANQQQPTAMAPPIMAPHQPAPLITPPATVAPATPAERIAQADQLKAYLLGEAAKGTDPAMCVDFLMEHMPPELNEGLLSADDPLALVCQVIPEAVPHKAWFGRLLDLIFEPLEPSGAAKQGQANGAAGANRPN